MKYSLAVFDMDGTILDTLDDLTNTLNMSLERVGMPVRTKDEVRSFVGNGVGKLLERAVPVGTTAEEMDALVAVFRENYAAHCADMTRPYDGIPEAIAELRRAGMKTAVVSNKVDFAVQALAEDYFPHLFDMAVGEREGVRRKPAPDPVFAVADALGVPLARHRRECGGGFHRSGVGLPSPRSARRTRRDGHGLSPARPCLRHFGGGCEERVTFPA